MTAIAWLYERFKWLSDYFYDAYLEINGFPWPFWYAAWPFYAISSVTLDIAYDFLDFGWWVGDITNKIRAVIGWDRIWINIRNSIYWIFLDIRKLPDWFTAVTQTVNEWWAAAMEEVLDLIDSSKAWAQIWIDYLQDQIGALTAQINDLVSLIPDMTDILLWFSGWAGNVVSVIDNWWTGALSEVQSLINSAFIVRENYWRGWQDWRDQVTEFFINPWDWLLSHFVDWFLGSEV